MRTCSKICVGDDGGSMRIQFRATDGGFDADDFSIICGVDGHDAEGVEHALSFDALSETGEAEYPREGLRVHTQFDDQSNSAYDRVSRCRLSRTKLTVDLSAQLGDLKG